MTAQDPLPPRDRDGYLSDPSHWEPAVAEAIAAAEGLTLTPEHWELIELVREFYRQHEVAPAMRPLVKRVKERLGADKGNSLYLLRLFPESPAKRLAKIAGLPRPSNCL